MTRSLPLFGLATLGLGLALWSTGSTGADNDVPQSVEALGERLFFDVNLSANRTQSCASCHDPARAFSDPRGAASPGDDGTSLGDRNAPTAMYAAMSPAFHFDKDGRPTGGQFLDGRAATLEEQAGGPPLNPIEMGMADEAAVVARLLEDPVYTEAFPALFGTDVLADTGTAYDAMTQAIASFERSETFAPFTSKYDRFLRGEVELTREEELGRLLFFSQQFTNCNLCHQLSTSAIDPRETFSNYQYFNIGTPVNADLRAMNGLGAEHVDEGLLDNPAIDDPAMRGMYRVPTLRNVAVTGPYMHNGVFEDLRTVILFYNKYNSRSEARQINPETGQPFGPPEVAENIAMFELTEGPALEDERIDALVAFLKTLTDEQYEYLLEE